MSEPQFTISLFNNVGDTTPRAALRTWAQLCKKFAAPVVRAEKDGPLFSPARFTGNRRLQDNVIDISMLVLELDGAWRCDCCGLIAPHIYFVTNRLKDESGKVQRIPRCQACFKAKCEQCYVAPKGYKNLEEPYHDVCYQTKPHTHTSITQLDLESKPLAEIADAVRAVFPNSAFALYSTHSHMRVTAITCGVKCEVDGKPSCGSVWGHEHAERCLRIVVPLLAPVSRLQFPALWTWAVNQLNEQGIPCDPQSKDQNRIFYTPVKASDEAPYEFHIEPSEKFFDWRLVFVGGGPEAAVCLERDEQQQSPPHSSSGASNRGGVTGRAGEDGLPAMNAGATPRPDNSKVFGVRVAGPRDKREPDAINTCSNSRGDWQSQLSPFRLGPVALSNGRTAEVFENAWQFSKVYQQHVGHGGEPSKDYWSWATAGWASRQAHRYPMGKGARPLYALWQGKKLDYVEARKQIYFPLYRNLVRQTDAFKRLRQMHQNGERIVLFDFDGYDYRSQGFSLSEALNNPTMKFGHAFVLAAMLIYGEDVTPDILARGSESEKLETQNSKLETVQFTCFEDLHAALVERIKQVAKLNTRDHYETRGVCHNGRGNTALAYYPESDIVHCNAGCDYWEIVAAFGLPDKRLPLRATIAREAAREYKRDWHDITAANLETRSHPLRLAELSVIYEQMLAHMFTLSVADERAVRDHWKIDPFGPPVAWWHARDNAPSRPLKICSMPNSIQIGRAVALLSRWFDLRGVPGFYYEMATQGPARPSKEYAAQAWQSQTFGNWRLNLASRKGLLAPVKDECGWVYAIQIYQGVKDQHPTLLSSRGLRGGAKAIAVKEEVAA